MHQRNLINLQWKTLEVLYSPFFLYVFLFGWLFIYLAFDLLIYFYLFSIYLFIHPLDVMKYMDNFPHGKVPKSVIVQSIIQLALNEPLLRDEVYCQICKQCTQNSNLYVNIHLFLSFSFFFSAFCTWILLFFLSFFPSLFCFFVVVNFIIYAHNNIEPALNKDINY